MTDRRPDTNPDSPPREDERGSVESLDQPGAREHDAADVEGDPDPQDGAVGGTDGITKNQEATAQ